jgi:hypothetical protein
VRPPSRIWQVVGFGAIVAFAIVVCMAVPGPGKRPENLFKKTEQPPPVEDVDPKANMPDLPFELENGAAHFGNPEAAVKVTAFIPGVGGCGNATAIAVKKIAEANKDRLSVEVLDFETESGAGRQEDLGVHCAGLVINGKQLIKTTDEHGNERTLEFSSNFGETYGEDELFQALDIEFQQAYGEKCKRVPLDAAQAPAAHDQGDDPEPTEETDDE